MVRIALVGVGFMGRTHLSVYSRLANAQVTALCDMREEQLTLDTGGVAANIETNTDVADLSGAARFTSYDELLAAGGFDAVDLCLPTYLHAEFAVKALEAGHHVFCEKPMALNEAESQRIVEAARAAGGVVGVGHCLRFWPAYRELKRMVDSREYGEAKSAHFWRHSSLPAWSWDDWIIDEARSGGAALDLHIHDTDSVRWIFGDPDAVSSVGVRVAGQGCAYISTQYRYDGKAITATSGWNFAGTVAFTMGARILFEQATVVMDFAKEEVVTVFPDSGTPTPVALPADDGYFFELEEFVNALDGGTEPKVVGAEEAAKSVRLCLKEIESVDTGKPVAV